MNTRFTKSGYSISVKVALARPKGLTLTALRKYADKRVRASVLPLPSWRLRLREVPPLPVAARLRSGRVAPTAGDACVVGIADSHGGGGRRGLSGAAAVAGRGMA